MVVVSTFCSPLLFQKSARLSSEVSVVGLSLLALRFTAAAGSTAASR